MLRAIFWINQPRDFWKLWNYPRFTGAISKFSKMHSDNLSQIALSTMWLLVLISIFCVIVSSIIGNRVIKKVFNYILIAVIFISFMVIIIITYWYYKGACHLQWRLYSYISLDFLVITVSPFIDSIWSFKLLIYSLK